MFFSALGYGARELKFGAILLLTLGILATRFIGEKKLSAHNLSLSKNRT